MHGAKQAYEKDLELYRQHLSQFIVRSCPGCGSDNSSFFCKHRDFSFTKCRSCWAVFMNPGPTEELVAQLYKSSKTYEYWGEYVYPFSAKKRHLELNVPRANYVMNAIGQLQHNSFRVLEFGAGTGDFLTYFQKQTPHCDAYAVEPNPAMWIAYEGSQVKLLQTSLEQINDFVENSKFDVVIAFEVLEHLLRPELLFERAKDLLNPGGKLIVSTPNSLSLEISIMKNLSNTLDIEHISVISPPAVHALATKYNFKVVQIDTPGQFDIELIRHKKYLKYLLPRIPFINKKLQEFISSNGFSSHMKFVLELNP
jgi:2-polyprenyl-3-methyl-5-hydroxy-6-metoxy-1,4-benzoquinol methylase